MSCVWLVFQDLFWQLVITLAVCVFCSTEILLLVEFLILSYFRHILYGPRSLSLSSAHETCYCCYQSSMVSDTVCDSLP